MPIDAEQLLKDEYFQLQKTVEDFDGRSLTIKAWSATLSTGGIGLAYQQEMPDLLLAAAAAAIAFWLIDWVWKLHQQAFYPRLYAIEDWFARPPAARGDPPAPLQIARAWDAATDAPEAWLRRRARAWFYPGVFLPHAVVALTALTLWLADAANRARLGAWVGLG